eukprot:3240788-Pleurochrysis_carterae.AAC.2
MLLLFASLPSWHVGQPAGLGISAHSPKGLHALRARPAVAVAPEMVTAAAAAEGRSLHELPERLRAVVGEDNVREGEKMRGARVGEANIRLLARPGTCLEAADVLSQCIASGATVVLQGANTGLTGGSLPRESVERTPESVLLNMRRLQRVRVIDQAHQVLCEAGVGIASLAKVGIGILLVIAMRCHSFNICVAGRRISFFLRACSPS